MHNTVELKRNSKKAIVIMTAKFTMSFALIFAISNYLEQTI